MNSPRPDQFLKSRKSIDDWMLVNCSQTYFGKHHQCKYTINEDFSVDATSDIYIANSWLEVLPIKFNIVAGNFYISCKLTSLIGCPHEVGRSFNCSHNRLTSLEGAPKEVGGHFVCSNNMLTSLKGSPREVGGDFICKDNYALQSLRHGPREVAGSFNCQFNKLTTLEGAPKVVGGDFDCSDNLLVSLKGAPSEVGEAFYCHRNDPLSSRLTHHMVGVDLALLPRELFI